MTKYVRILTVLFDAEINYKEIPLFRGAVLKSMGDKADLLFHNHAGETTFRYSYPLIQYKRIGGKAAIVCVNEGADVIGQFLSESEGFFRLGERMINYKIDKISPVKFHIQTWQAKFRYYLNRWLPLNAKNYRLYQTLNDERERICFLENILKGNMLSMLKGLDIFVEEEVTVKIISLTDSYITYNKGVALMAFDARFLCNLSIPNNIGIGKNASIGFGVIRQDKNNKQ